MDKYVQFKHLLEYFVAHLDWVTKNPQGRGYQKYIEGRSLLKSGRGYSNKHLQSQIDKWDKYGDDTICISVNAGSQKPFINGGTYLQWKGTDIDVRPDTDGQDSRITSLYITTEPIKRGIEVPSVWSNTIEELGLFDKKDPNKTLKDFFNFYENAYKNKKDEGAHKQTLPNSEENKQMTDEIISLLKASKNLILTGAPGTGKTFMAKKIAENMDAVYDMVQFHPSYDYTDFVEGLRPVKDGTSQIGFERKDGKFKSFCEKALGDKARPYVFIIDEINRGEISKIFGELFFSIDPGYRGVEGSILTQYSNLQTEPNAFDKALQGSKKNDATAYGHFFVPENVYILGTMNDIDRGVESMDFAIRRRFAWKEIKAKDSECIIDATDMKDKIKVEAKKRMASLNNAIRDCQELGEPYCIGGAYFKKIEECGGQFSALWENHLQGVLAEYLRGTADAQKQLEKFENAYNLKVTDKEPETPDE